MSIFGLPLIMYQVPSGVDMGDLEYIEGKVIDGNYFQESGDINNLNDTIEFVVPNNKTAFMIEAKITMTTNPSASSSSGGGTNTTKDEVVAQLKIDTAVKDKAAIGVASSASSQISATAAGNGSGSGFGRDTRGKFNVLGLSLVGDAIKKIEIENILDDGFAFATMSGYLIDT